MMLVLMPWYNYAHPMPGRLDGVFGKIVVRWMAMDGSVRVVASMSSYCVMTLLIFFFVCNILYVLLFIMGDITTTTLLSNYARISS